jgi:hypothetical protein
MTIIIEGATQWEWVDEHITDVHPSVGDKCRSQCLREWFESNGLDLDVSDALAAHRNHPENRLFGLERCGMGPNTYYVVTDTKEEVNPAAVFRMHHQQSEENMARWQKERHCRMNPIAKRHPVAQRALDRADMQMQLVALTLDVDLEYALAGPGTDD